MTIEASAQATERWCPRVTVAAVIRNGRGQYLLVEETPEGQPVLNQPAGHLEPGESLVEAVIREVREETCYGFTPSGLVGIYRWQVARGAPTYLRFCFAGTVGDRLPGEPDPATRAIHWLDAEALREGRWRMRSPLVRRCIEDAAGGRLHPLDLIHEMGIGDGG